MENLDSSQALLRGADLGLTPLRVNVARSQRSLCDAIT